MVPLQIPLIVHSQYEAIVRREVPRNEWEDRHVLAAAVTVLGHDTLLGHVAKRCLSLRSLPCLQLLDVLVAEGRLQDDQVELGRVKGVQCVELGLHPAQPRLQQSVVFKIAFL